ncbi:unnamed protein product, partial [Discosporangium mesarthrocarpum]
DGFDVLDKIGTGSFGTVWTARRRRKDTSPSSTRDYEPIVALKRINSTCSPQRILNEYRHMCRLGGRHNVVSVEGLVRTPGGCFGLVMPYFEHDEFIVYMRTLSYRGMAFYMRSLLEALAHVHEKGVIHRDIKPRNFMYSLSKRTGLLIDFGLAESAEVWKPRVKALNRLRRAKSASFKWSCRHPDGSKRRGSPESKRQQRVSGGTLARTRGGSRAGSGLPLGKDGQGGVKLLRKAERAGTTGFRAPEIL